MSIHPLRCFLLAEALELMGRSSNQLAPFPSNPTSQPRLVLLPISQSIIQLLPRMVGSVAVLRVLCLLFHRRARHNSLPRCASPPLQPPRAIRDYYVKFRTLLPNQLSFNNMIMRRKHIWSTRDI
jgi:hypothetical protein